MIAHLRGHVWQVLPSSIVLDVGGVGYGVEAPLPLVADVQVGQPLSLWVYTHVREDGIRLFGFGTAAQRTAFELLLSVSGVGPRIAMAVLSTVSTGTLCQILMLEDIRRLTCVPNVGPRLAERMLLELRPKVPRLTEALAQHRSGGEAVPREGVPSQILPELWGVAGEDAASAAERVLSDVQSALENVGYRAKEIQPTLKAIRQKHPQGEFSVLMREALRILQDATS